MLDYEDWITEQDEDADTSFEAYLDWSYGVADLALGGRDEL